jgi:G3E family GTPase
MFGFFCQRIIPSFVDIYLKNEYNYLYMIPITIITGFLGAGKTTLINKMIEENSNTRFGLIINEFGEVGVDSELVAGSEQEITEISNGCLCCVVRSDLTDAVKKMIATNKIDHLIIETSGLAEPAPIASTFVMDNLDNKVVLDAIICLIDADNFETNISNYNILKEQINTSDIAILNKLDDKKEDFNNNLRSFVNSINPHIAILENTQSFNSKLLLDALKDIEDKIIEVEANSKESHSHNHNDHDHDHDHNHNHDHSDHHHHDHAHEHEEFMEVLYQSEKDLDPAKLDIFFMTNFPKNVIRAKGFLKLDSNIYLYQMVGANKALTPYTHQENTKLNKDSSYLVFIGKDLDSKFILEQMSGCEK